MNEYGKARMASMAFTLLIIITIVISIVSFGGGLICLDYKSGDECKFKIKFELS